MIANLKEARQKLDIQKKTVAAAELNYTMINDRYK